MDIKLTQRQEEMLPLLLTGMAVKEIARRQGLSYFTARGRAATVYQKFGIYGWNRQVQLIVKVRSNGHKRGS